LGKKGNQFVYAFDIRKVPPHALKAFTFPQREKEKARKRRGDPRGGEASLHLEEKPA